jgi:hypothetical protein
MDQITIGYLSWKRHNILEQTLYSHYNNRLLNIIKHKLIYFQEISNNDINIANKFCLKNILGNIENVGIKNGFISLVNNCETDYFIFCENDWLLIENEQKTYDVLTDCINMLKNNNVDIIRLRHAKNPGSPLYSKPENVNKWLNQNIINFPYKLESLSWLDDPNKYYNNLLEEYDGNYKWYITTNEHQKWSNNIFIAKTSYLRDIIIPFLNNSNNNKKYDGMETILINNIDINIRIAGGVGLFKHQDTLQNL